MSRIRERNPEDLLRPGPCQGFTSRIQRIYYVRVHVKHSRAVSRGFITSGSMSRIHGRNPEDLLRNKSSGCCSRIVDMDPVSGKTARIGGPFSIYVYLPQTSMYVQIYIYIYDKIIISKSTGPYIYMCVCMYIYIYVYGPVDLLIFSWVSCFMILSDVILTRVQDLDGIVVDLQGGDICGIFPCEYACKVIV